MNDGNEDEQEDVWLCEYCTFYDSYDEICRLGETPNKVNNCWGFG